MHTPLSSGLPGLLFVWTDVEAEHEQDFNLWYDREHVQERVALPGFVSGVRYRCVQGPRRYLGLYRTRDLSAFATPEYARAFQQQTPWSVTNLQRMRNPMRRVCTISAEVGAGRGAWLAVLLLGQCTGTDLQATLADLGEALQAMPGVVGSRLLTPDPQLSTPLPMESREGRVLDALFLVDAASQQAAQEAGLHAARQLQVEPSQLAVLSLSWQLLEQDLPASAHR